MSESLPESGGTPDWEKLIADAQSLPPAVDSPALQAQAARRAETVAKFTAANRRED